jgi:hypothetical protein
MTSTKTVPLKQKFTPNMGGSPLDLLGKALVLMSVPVVFKF